MVPGASDSASQRIFIHQQRILAMARSVPRMCTFFRLHSSQALEVFDRFLPSVFGPDSEFISRERCASCWGVVGCACADGSSCSWRKLLVTLPSSLIVASTGCICTAPDVGRAY